MPKLAFKKIDFSALFINLSRENFKILISAIKHLLAIT